MKGREYIKRKRRFIKQSANLVYCFYEFCKWIPLKDPEFCLNVVSLAEIIFNWILSQFVILLYLLF